MIITNQSYTVIPQEVDVNSQEDLANELHKHIELCGRVCYKSEDKITDTSAWPFCERMIKSGHGAMLEHGTVYFKLKRGTDDKIFDVLTDRDRKYFGFNYLPMVITRDRLYNYISTNFRYIVELLDMILEKDREAFKMSLIEHVVPFNPCGHELRLTVKFVTNRNIAQSITRHRKHSFAMESTRYVNYAKDRFGSQLTFIRPNWVDVPIGEYATMNDVMSTPDLDAAGIGFLKKMKENEDTYMMYVNDFGWQAQQALIFLPQDVKSDLLVTGFLADWAHFFNLRAIGTTGAPHPMVKELADPLMREMMRSGVYDEYMEFDMMHKNAMRSHYEKINIFMENYKKYIDK